jgi:hypothetical protein
MLQDLPVEVLHAVYDMLIVEDRLSLNMALPKHRRISSTIKTSTELDTKLHCISRSMKRLSPEQHQRVLGKNQRLNGNLRRLLDAHASDPTVKRILGDEVAVAEVPKADQVVDAFVAAIQTKDVAAIERMAKEEEQDLAGNCFHASDIVRALVGIDDIPTLLPKLLGTALFVDALRIYNLFWKSSFLFDLVIRRQGVAIGQILALPEDERQKAGFGEENIAHFWISGAMHACSSPEAAEFLLETMAQHVTDERLASLIEACVGQVNVPVLEVLLRPR